MRAPVLLAVALLALVAAPAPGQTPPPVGTAPGPEPGLASAAAVRLSARATAGPLRRGWPGTVAIVPGRSDAPNWPEAFRAPGGAFAASLVVPGAGQAALGLGRWPVYVALEAGFWWLWADARGDFRGFRDGYRDLAWETARIQDGPRRDGGWSYYEAMSRHLASGAFDTDPAPGTQPEEDPATYNGAVWEIARGIHLPGGSGAPGTPEYAAALAWYEVRAAGPGFLWSWAGREAELGRFRGLIDSADDARRTQTTALGVILANHLVSAIDALLAARLRGSVRPELDSGAVDGPAGATWRLRVRLPLPDGHEQDG